MSENELNIAEVRAKCNAVVDFLISSYQESYTNIINFHRNQMDKIRKQFGRKSNLNDNLLSKIGYVIKLGLNFLSIHVLGIEQENLDFSSCKSNSDSVKVFIDPNCSEMKYIRVLEGDIKTLNDLKQIIATSDSLAVLFYKKFMYNIAVNKLPFIDVFYPTMEEMKVPIYSSRIDRKVLEVPEGESRYTRDKIYENTVSDIFYSNKCDMF